MAVVAVCQHALFLVHRPWTLLSVSWGSSVSENNFANFENLPFVDSRAVKTTGLTEEGEKDEGQARPRPRPP